MSAEPTDPAPAPADRAPAHTEADADPIDAGSTDGGVPELTITDGTVALRPIRSEDAAAITDACQDEVLQTYIPVPRPYTRADADAYITLSRELWPTGRKAVFSILDAGGGEADDGGARDGGGGAHGHADGESPAAGDAGSHPDGDAGQRFLGVMSLTIAGNCGNAAYWVAPGARGRQVARRALALLSRWAFDRRGLAVLLLEIRDANEASKAVAVACGFHHSGSIEVPTDHGPQSALLYVRLASDQVPHARPVAP